MARKPYEIDEVTGRLPPLKKRQRPAPKLQPPMTPMIDVTFQLLLFFLLACEFRESEGIIPGSLPAKGNITMDSTDVPPPNPIQITVRPSSDRSSATYEVTGVAVMISAPEELYGSLLARQQALGSKDVPVMIVPQGDVPWEFVVEAFNQSVRAEFTKIGFGLVM